MDNINNKQSEQATPKQIEPYTAFPVDVLPNAVGEFVRAAANAIGCDTAFIALPLLGCLARAIGNKRTIKLKRTWTEPAIIWAAIVGKSGTRKSPAIATAMHLLHRRQSEAVTAFTEAVTTYEQERAIYDRDYAAWKGNKKGPTEPPPWKPEEPSCERYVTTDCTIEALAALLAAQFDGVLVIRDELAGWLSGIQNSALTSEARHVQTKPRS